MTKDKVPGKKEYDEIHRLLDREYLRAGLARLDLFMRRAAQRWQLSGQNPADDFRGLYVSDQEAAALLDRPFGAGWGDLVTLPEDDEVAYERGLASIETQMAGMRAEAARKGVVLRMLYLQYVFQLTPLEIDFLLVCLAPTLDPRYEKLYGYLQDDVTRKRPTLQLALALLSQPGLARMDVLAFLTRPDAPLFSHNLIERGAATRTDLPPLLNTPLTIDETLVHWLLGSPALHPALENLATLEWAESSHPETTADAAQPTFDAVDPETILVFSGPDQAAQDGAARDIAANGMYTSDTHLHHGNIGIRVFARSGDTRSTPRPLLILHLDQAVNPSNFERYPYDQLHLLRLAQRDARLHQAILYIKGWDSALQDGSVRQDIFQSVCQHPDQVILSGQAAWLPSEVPTKENQAERKFKTIYFPIPVYGQRLRLWQRYLPPTAAQKLPAETLHLLAGQFALTTGQIRDAAASIYSLPEPTDAYASQPASLSAAVLAAARKYSNPRLSSLAQKIVPRYDWDDVILPDDQRQILREIIATVSERPRVLDEWGVGLKLASSRGITVLFAGPPGTGKTMAAEVIARSLGLDLFKIDLSSIVSKYIGETEKNLEKIFNEAASSNAILFFDEADALFGKRSEVRDSHDRYANIEISYLLQRMEAYDGVTILATNLRANLDEAFTRRLHFAVDFPFPEAPDRLRIWQTLFPTTVPRAENLDFNLLAKRFKLAGGNIRNVIVNAAYLAASNGGSVTMDHLFHGIRRELQKMGRLVSEGDLLPDDSPMSATGVFARPGNRGLNE